jgi:ABC-type uncharacterized transport system auxiliary subunit
MSAMTAPTSQLRFFKSAQPGPRPRRPWLIALLFVLLAPLLGGCGKPPMLINQYILEYPAPMVGNRTKLPEGIKVELFSVAQAFNTTSMVYQPQPFKSETYNYSRWRANPGYLVTDYLLRDFREAHQFQAVCGPGSSGKYRYLLEGGVVEFQEVDEPGCWKVVLALTVTLLDTTKQELPQRVVFQKNYRAAEPMPERTPQGLAQGMSRAMEHLSGQIIVDTVEAARRRSGTK